jgi:hypothetical protein
MNLFIKRDWSKWEHVMFVEDFSCGIPTYEIRVRTCLKTGITQYKRIYVAKRVHGLYSMLRDWKKKLLDNA